MVSYYNIAMYPKNHGTNLPYSPSASWYPGNYHHQPPNQFLGDSETPPQTMYYPHPHPMFQSSPDWGAHENYSGPQSSLLQTGPGSGGNGIGNTTTGGNGTSVHLNQNGNEHINEGISSLPSPPITVSGSEMSSPGAPNGSASPHAGNNRPTPAKSPFEWMKKTSYQNQPNPGKTRTKDKYRVVYSDHQRLELEKEFHTSRYITIRRKTELAQFLQLSERQVKIWFQNRRAKERKQAKKRDDNPNGSSLPQHHNGSLLDVKPKIEPGYHPALHQMSAMSMGMSAMGLHHHHHHPLHSHLSVPTSQQVGPSSIIGI